MTTLASRSEQMFRAVLIDPFDGLARLAYADALEEEGQASLAELVRSDEKTVRGDGVSYLPPGAAITLRGGLPDAVKCPLDWWLKSGPAVCRWGPVVFVLIADREPVPVFGGKWELPIGSRRGGVPWDVADHMQKLSFAGPSEGMAYLSLGCINWARGRAGLPPLPEAMP